MYACASQSRYDPFALIYYVHCRRRQIILWLSWGRIHLRRPLGSKAAVTPWSGRKMSGYQHHGRRNPRWYREIRKGAEESWCNSHPQGRLGSGRRKPKAGSWRSDSAVIHLRQLAEFIQHRAEHLRWLAENVNPRGDYLRFAALIITPSGAVRYPLGMDLTTRSQSWRIR